jgi:chorismate mutase
MILAMLFSGLLLLTGCQEKVATQSALSTESACNELLEAVRDRLHLMPEVARCKVFLSLPTDDPAREAELIQAIELDAPHYQVDKNFARDVFTAQFAAARFYQERLRLKIQAPAKVDEESLKRTGEEMKAVRSKINATNARILKTLARINQDRGQSQKILQEKANEILKDFDADIRTMVLKPLVE